MQQRVETKTSVEARPYYPVRVEPPKRPLGSLAFMARFIQNPLKSIPEAVYREDFVMRRQGKATLVWITEPSMIKDVMLDRREAFPKSTQIKTLSPLLGKGLLTSEGSEWKWQRQASAPEFRHADLLAMVPTFTAAAEKQVRAWAAAPSSSPRPIHKDMTACTFDVISATLLPSGDTTIAPAIEHAAGDFQRGTSWRLLYGLLRAPAWAPQPGRARAYAAIRALRGSALALIEERRALASPPDDLMARLMRAKHPETGALMSDQQLVDNLLTFYLAGHETTAKTLTWTLYLLSQAPDWGDRIAAETEAVTAGKPVAAEHIDKLVVTQQVVKESMRLFPPAPMMSRQPLEDTTIGGHAIPAGAQVIMPIYAIQRHQKYWTDPDRFDPGRFTPESEKTMSRYVYMPFGAGPRICIGMAFAMIEATAMLATLARAARFSSKPGLAPEPLARVTLIPKGGMPLAVSMR